MKYILFLAFEYKHYKKPSVIELFADDLLIDSIELHDSINRKNGKLVHPIQQEYENPDLKPKKLPSISGYGSGVLEFRDPKYGKWKYWGDRWSVCEKVFTFEIDESVLKNKLTLNVINHNNNNYTNGFMSKASSFQFDVIALLPKKYFENIDLVDKELPDVLGVNHGRSSPYDHDIVQDWFWPAMQNLAYDPDNDDWIVNGHDDFISSTLTIGNSFRYDFELTEWNGIKVIRPKNVSDRFLNELYCIMDPVFLTYVVKARLNK